MSRSKSRRRRWLGIAIAAAAVAMILTGAVAAVLPPQQAPPTAEPPSTRPDLPASFELPAPYVGDRGRFEIQSASGSPAPLAEFEWLPDQFVRDADGAGAKANVLRYVHHATIPGRGDVLQERLVFFRPGTDLILATQFGGAWGKDDDSSALRGNKTSTVYGDGLPLPPLVCGIRNGLQGQRTALPAAIHLGEGCQVLGLSAAAEGVRLVPDAIGVSEEPGRDLLRIVADGAAASPVRVWLASDVPYPVRYESTNGSGEEVVRLAGFERGTEPIASTSGPAEAGPALIWEPTLPWGLNDSFAADHPWPLSKAHAWMMGEAPDDAANPAPSDIPDFLEAHAGAFLFYARYTESMNRGRSTYVWDVAFTDGRDSIRRCAMHEVQHWVRQALITGTPADSGTYEANMYDGSCPSEKPNEFTAFPPGPPQTMPTLASLAERWRAHAGKAFAERPVNAWSYEVVCPDWTCEQVGLRVSVGYLRDAIFHNSNGLVEGPITPPESGFAYSALRVDGTGRASWLDETSEWRGDGGAWELPLTPDGPVQAQGDSAAPLSAIAPAPWTNSFTIAATGLAAMAVGIGFWFWGAIQGAIVAAFSRLHKDKAAEHPTRAAILELLEANPGLHLHEIRRRLHLGNGRAIHHLEKLVRLGLLTTVVAPGYTCYFPTGKLDYRLMSAAPTLKADTARRLLLTLREGTALTAAEMAARAQLSPRLVGYHLDRLRRSGLVEVDSADRRHLVRSTPLGSEAMAAGLFFDSLPDDEQGKPSVMP